MAEVRNQRQRERAEARKGRRVEPDEPADQNDSDQSDRSDLPSFDLKRVAATAVTAALAGALAGAAKAVVDKRGRSSQPRRDDGGEDEQEPVSASPEDAEPEPERQTTDEGEADEEPEGEAQVDAGEPDDRDEPVRAQAQDHNSEQMGASTGEVASMIARAKQHAEAVIGSEPESVSGVERSNGNWRVNVEIVQLRRIPESTDILASYAVMLDGDGDLLSVQELRRYRRSQAEDGR